MPFVTSTVDESSLDAQDAADILLTDLVTYASATVPSGDQWTVLRNTVFTDESGDGREVILEGQGSGGTDEIIIGIRSRVTTESAAVRRYWELRAFTAFNGAETWENQPGPSPSAYMPLVGGAMTYWFFVSPRRILPVVRISNSYINGYLGFYQPYATPSEAPYPILVHGMSDSPGTLFSGTSQNDNSGIAHPNNNGYWRDAIGTWNRISGATTRSLSSSSVGAIHPWTGSSAASPAGHSMSEGSYTSRLSLFSGAEHDRTLVDLEHFPMPCILWQSSPARNMLGEIEGVYAMVGRAGELAVEDTIDVPGLGDIRVYLQGAQNGAEFYFGVLEV